MELLPHLQGTRGYKFHPQRRHVYATVHGVIHQNWNFNHWRYEILIYLIFMDTFLKKITELSVTQLACESWPRGRETPNWEQLCTSAIRHRIRPLGRFRAKYHNTFGSSCSPNPQSDSLPPHVIFSLSSHISPCLCCLDWHPLQLRHHGDKISNGNNEMRNAWQGRWQPGNRSWSGIN